MRKLLLVLIAAAISFTGAAQLYNPSLHTVTNKAIGIAQANPTDARSFYYDQTLFKYRPYQSTGEVLTYLNLQKYRFGNFPIYVNLSGTLQPDGSYTDSTITEYWFIGCVNDTCLKVKTSGGGGGGTGTVTDVSAMWGVQTFPALGITTSGTVNVDSGLVTSKAWLYKVADSLGALIGTGGSLRTIYVTQRGDAGDTVITALNDSTLWASRLRDSTGIAIDRASDGALVIRNTIAASVDPSLSTLNGLGLPVVAQTFPLELSTTTTRAGSDNRIDFYAIYIPSAQTITGVYYYLQTQGVFTADGFNGFGLYSYSGGTLTQVAVTANDGTFFSATAGGKSAAFTTPYSASAGVYYVAWLYCQSAQTTAPGLTSKTATLAFGSGLFTNSASLALFWNGQTALPSSVAASGVTGVHGAQAWIGLY